MAAVEDTRTGGFTFTWTIHNFSYCVQKESEYLDSPVFEPDLSTSGKKWYLRLYPKGDDVSGFISLYLQQVSKNNHHHIYYFAFSIRVSNGKFKELGNKQFNTNLFLSEGYNFFLSLYELNKPYLYLQNDTLTLRCCMRKGGVIPTTVNCYAHTYIKVSKIDYTWTLNDVLDCKNDNKIIETKFNEIIKIPSTTLGLPIFQIQLLYGGNFGYDTFHFAIKKAPDTKQSFLICTIHLLDADGRIAHSSKDENLFPTSSKSQTWTFPFISKHKLLSTEELYLPNGRLTLQCNFSVSTGDVNSEIERVECRRTDDLQVITSIEEQVSDFPELWKKNMQQFYLDGKFSDVTIRTSSIQFPVHKAILCAQSKVFSTMFERKMKENFTGVVEIEDLEDNIISKFLMFLYTDTLVGIDFTMACKLYFAADKYQVTTLHRKCSNYLIHSLDTSNVCDVLDLADTHQDQVLKSIAQNFIFVHDREIINSEDWKKLMEAKAYLTSETMQLMICKKLYALNIGQIP